jgi:hypothetical protein
MCKKQDSLYDLLQKHPSPLHVSINCTIYCGKLCEDDVGNSQFSPFYETEEIKGFEKLEQFRTYIRTSFYLFIFP